MLFKALYQTSQSFGRFAFRQERGLITPISRRESSSSLGAFPSQEEELVAYGDADADEVGVGLDELCICKSVS